MKRVNFRYSQSWLNVLSGLLLVGMFAIAGCMKDKFPKNPKAFKDFEQVNLVANNNEYAAARIDDDFINAWGIAFAPTGPAWVNTEATGLSYVLNKDGGDLRPPVTIPSSMSDSTGGKPSGIVFNGTSDFKLMNGNPARFIFVGTDGILSGWNGGNSAQKILDNSASSSYTGLALASDGGSNFLYAANFEKAKIDVFDASFNEVNKPFVDPDLPAGYSPFNIQNIGGKLYVLYAKQNGKEPDEEVTGSGLGYVDIFNADGSFWKRFASQGQLNAPWGIALAPNGFWGDDSLSGAQIILVGNFGDGHINAYNAEGKFLKELRAHGKPIVIEGLWAIVFPPATATNGINTNALYFSAGPDDEADGLYGYLVKKEE